MTIIATLKLSSDSKVQFMLIQTTIIAILKMSSDGKNVISTRNGSQISSYRRLVSVSHHNSTKKLSFDDFIFYTFIDISDDVSSSKPSYD